MSSYFPQGSFFGIDFMGSSLDNFQTAVNVTSNNISNIDTPGASQQVVDFTEAQPIVGSPFMSTHVLGTAGEGVLIAQIQRIQSNADDALFRGATASQNYFTTEQTALQSVQSSLGDPNAGVSTQYTAFQTAVNQLVSQESSTDSSNAAQQNVLESAQALATSLNTSAGAVQTAEQSAISQGNSLVTQVNGILQQIAALNGNIRASTAAGDSPNTFEDQRDNLIDQLSQYISTNTSVLPDGSTLVTVNGQALVNDTVVYQLADPVIGTGANGQPTFKINFQSTPAASPSSPGIPLGSGQLGALQDLYNNKLSVYGTQLDQFASGLANEVNRVTEGGYDENGEPGTALFQSSVSGQSITATNIVCGITNPASLPVVMASTAAGNLVVPMNSANNTVDTSALIDGNNNLANPPAADVSPVVGGVNGTLTINVDGQAQVFAYNTNSLAPGANSTTVNQFITNFNAGGYGVDASFDTASQSIVFARDPSNESLVLRGAQQGAAQTPDFTITDSNAGATGILGTLGAGAINGVDQNETNAYGANDNGGANALINVFQNNAGVPALETTSGAAVTGTAGVPMTVALPNGVTNVAVGQILTLDATAGGGLPQENVTVTAVSESPLGVESVTFTPAQNHLANFSITSAQTQTLGQFYGNFITQVGLDTQTAITGSTTQTNLASSINSARQSYQGINLDEETQNLIEYQSAYQAAARTINTLSQMLDTVISSLGVTSAGA